MRLISLQANNFLSYKEIDLQFSKDKNITFLIGKNGVGKSSLVEAILWGIFGKTNRNSLEKFIPNIQDPKKAKVSLAFGGNELLIERQKNPPLFSYISKNEKIRLQTITETQESLDIYLHHSYKLFLATSFFDDILKNAFLELSSEDKRQVVGQYFELDDFFKLRKLIRSSSDDLKNIIKHHEYFEKVFNFTTTNFALKSSIIEKQYLDFWVEALSDNGIIKNVLSPTFQQLTNKINFYLKLLFDENIFFSLTPDYESYLRIDGMELGIKSISSSQKKRVNLSIMLGLRELLTELKNPKLGNLMIFDEFSGLDPFSKTKLCNLITHLGKTNQIFLITHDMDFLSLIDSNVLEVTFEDGFSKCKFK